MVCRLMKHTSVFWSALNHVDLGNRQTYKHTHRYFIDIKKSHYRPSLCNTNDTVYVHVYMGNFT